MLHQLYKKRKLEEDRQLLFDQTLGIPRGWTVDKLIEEMAELTQALIKNRHHGGGKYSKKELMQHVYEEMAHVQIKLNQLMAITIGIDSLAEQDFMRYYDQKIKEIRIKLKK